MEENQVHIPDGWDLKPLGEIFNFKYGSGLPTNQFSPSGYPVYGANGIIGWHSKYNYENQEILISCRGENSGLINLTEEKAFVTNNSIVCSEKFEIDKIYFYYNLKKIPRTAMVSGSAQPQVVVKDLNRIELLFPKSKTEQTTIARILSKVDEAIAQTEQLIAKYTRIKTGLMQDLLTKGIDEHGNIRSEETHEFKDSPLGRIPKEWEVKRLDQMTKPNSPIVYGILMPGKHFFGGIPVVKVKDIFDEKIHFGDLLFTNPKIALAFKRSELMKDDLLFTIRGTVGRCAFVPVELEGANITQDTARIRVKNEYKEYVRYTFETPDSKFYIQLNTIGQAVKGINLKALRELNILVPPPNEAQLIAKELNTSNNVLSAEAIKLRKLQSLKTGLMQDLLSGKVRVKI
ncbi:restriction endonuclease subunit S [Mongoliitalea lutea]|uniref:Type I restriction modification DNA specificity domain-containing protein n=1 Tax=Mongoliitalea lutea TaxID=849756 RepID=A0A8J3CZG1_9BACT|nr:restriction endonuclease subunit S [Mongoliitalea lutea]GHB49093.1 hypothetical protein GCM10008106_32340 [Mongoliitalea lutea]